MFVGPSAAVNRSAKIPSLSIVVFFTAFLSGGRATASTTAAGPLFHETCVNASSGEAGRCMFALDCFRSSGRHIGICTRGFYYGSCCSIPLDSPEDLPRVPIMVPTSGNNELLDSGLWNSIWSDWMNEIYSFVQHAPTHKRPAINFPQSSFHASSSNPISTTTTTSTTEAAPVTSTTSDRTSTVTDLSAITSALLPNPTSGSNPVITLMTSSPSSVPNLTIIYASTMSPTDTLPPFIEEESSNEHEFEIEPPDSPPDLITSSESTNTTSTTSMPIVIQAIVNATVNVTVVSAGQQPANLTNRDESTTAVCGKPVYRWPKIVSGENARPGQWPWQISLQEKTRRGYFHRCGASLLTREWAVTAAHCLNNVQSENLLVRLGGLDFASYEDKFEESKVQAFPHPKFNVQTQQYDIALLKLLTPVVYQSSTLPICLPERDMEFDNETSFVSGWGRLSEKGPTSPKLQYVGVPIISNEECEKIYRPINKYIDHRSICAGFPMGLKDSCEGDSGGPMMVFKRRRWVLAGVISWGVGCARPNQPGVSTRVTEFLDWIQSHIGTIDG